MIMNATLQPGDRSVTKWFGWAPDTSGSAVEVIERTHDLRAASGVMYLVRTIDTNRPVEAAWIDASWLK